MQQRLATKRSRGHGGPRSVLLPAEPEHAQSAALLALQRSAGNQAVVRLLEGTVAGAPDVGYVSQVARQAGVPVRTETGAQHALGRRPVVQRGFWKKLGSGVKKAAKAVGGGVKKAAKAVGGGLKKAAGWVKGAAGWVKKAAGKVWNGVTWVAEQTWTKLEGIWGRAKQWVTKLPGRLGRLMSHLWDGVKGLKPWSLQWWSSLGQADTWKSFGKWLGEFAVYALEVAGIGEAYETIMDFVKFNTRALTGEERAKGKKVFGNAIPWELVRVDSNALLGPSWTDREYVSFNTINGWSTMSDHTLIHELTHVWQYNKMGAIYMPKAIHAQGTTEGYDYGGVTKLQERRAAGGDISGFNLEQQGQILGDYYVLRWQKNTPPSSPDVQTYEHFVSGVRR